MNDQYREIQAWLEGLYAGAPVPTFEITPQSLEILTELRLKNQRQDSMATVMMEDLAQKSQEYQTEGDRISNILSQLGLSLHALSQSGSASLKTIVGLASLLQVKDTTNTSLLLAINDLNQQKMSIEEQRLQEQRLGSTLFSKTKTAMVNCQSLNKVLEDLEEQAKFQGVELQKKAKQTSFLKAKVRDYRKNLQELQLELAKSGVEPSVYHHNLVKKAEDLQSLRDKLHPLKASLDSYQKLPPDLSLAKVKLEEVRQTLAKLEGELSNHIDLMHM